MKKRLKNKKYKIKLKLNKTLKQRQKDYGSFETNACFTMQFYEKNRSLLREYRRHIDNINYDMIQFYIFNIGAKLARLSNNPNHLDSYRDLKGYTKVFKESCHLNVVLKPLNRDKNHIKLIKRLNAWLEKQI